MSRKVAVVTGGNKGLGFGIVRRLCREFEGDVILSARSEERGRQAVSDLEKEGLKPIFHQLDIDDKGSIKVLADFISKTYGGLDILVNNAGIAFDVDSTAPFSEQAEVTMKTNYFGTLAVCQGLFPLLRPGARVVHVSSLASNLAMMLMSHEKQQDVLGCRTVDEISRLMNQFVQDVKSRKGKGAGWSNTAYGTTKLGVTAMTPIQQTSLDRDPSRPDIVVNAVCPGLVATEMNNFKGMKTVDEGADTPVYAALLPARTTIRGQFISDRIVEDWKANL